MSLQLDGNVLRGELDLVEARRAHVLPAPREGRAAESTADEKWDALSIARLLGEPIEPAPPERSAVPSTDSLSEKSSEITPSTPPGGPGRPADVDPGLTDHFKRAHQLRPFGLALSGGGIRSATFNLGLLQGLADLRLVKYIDFLSTVSGGGYIGGWLHGLIRNRCGGDVSAAERILSPRERPAPSTPETDPISFLRKYSNYLAPRPGLFSADSWVIGSIWLRNVGLNQLILAPTLSGVILFLLLVGFCQQAIHAALSEHGEAGVIVLLAAFVLGSFAAATEIAAANLNAIRNPMAADAASLDASGRVAPLIFIYGVIIGCAGLERSPWIWSGILFVGLFASLVALQRGGGFPEAYVQGRRTADGSAKESPRQLRYARWVLLPFFAFLSASVGVGLIVLVWTRLSDAATPLSPWARLAFGPPGVAIGILAAFGLLVGLMGRDYPDAAREWLARIGATVALLCAAWVGVFLAAVFGPYAFSWLIDRYLVAAVTIGAGWVLTTVAGVRAARSRHASADSGARRSRALRILLAAAPTLFLVGYLLVLSSLVHVAVGRAAGIAARGSWTPFSQPVNYDVQIHTPDGISSMQFDLRSTQTPAWALPLLNRVDGFEKGYWEVLQWRGKTAAVAAGFLLLCIVVAVGCARRFDINEFSMHHFYKNRLVRCYLGASSGSKQRPRRPNPFTGFDPDDDFPLADLTPFRAGDPYFGPCPIVNAALNVNAGAELAQQERKAMAFVFTPAYCGFQSRSTKTDDVKDLKGSLETSGYDKTQGFGSPEGPSLGTALAISGAAANPNSGANTSAPLAFLLTVFDARLGWWLPNPRWPSAVPNSGPNSAWWYLFCELFAQTTDRSRYVNVSDGGHFENLGLYELVRRRCRYILVGDAEEDGDLTFNGLGGAIRKCRADFGVEIDINPRPIRLVHGASTAHCVMGSIRYPEGEAGEAAGFCEGEPRSAIPGEKARGWLLYVKSSLTGDEPADVAEYHSAHPRFPHQSTANQFFSESQFESYRRLGLHAVRSAFGDVPRPTGTTAPQELLSVFQKLASKWYAPIPVSSQSATRLANAYARLMRALPMVDPILAAEMLPPGAPSAPMPSGLPSTMAGVGIGTVTVRPQVMVFGLEVIQLMQNVFTEFQLEHEANRANPRNGGWMAVFLRWANSDTFYGIWTDVRSDYNVLFRDFMEDLRKDALRSRPSIGATDWASRWVDQA